MRVLHINSSDIYGGAAKAVLSLHNSLMNENIQSYILTNNKNNEIKNDISKSSSLRNIIDIFKNAKEKFVNCIVQIKEPCRIKK